MKKGLYIITAVLSISAFSSCLKETNPTGYITKDRLDTVLEEHPEKFDALVQAMYADIQSYVDVNMSHNYFGQMSFNYLTSLMGNDMIMTNRYGMSIYHYLLDYWQHNYTPTSNRWREYYRHIANANTILQQVPSTATDPTQLFYRAIALGIRGYAYLQLSYLYQYSYYVGADDTVWGKGAKYDHSDDPLVPLIDENTVEDQPRAKVKDVFAKIVSDLEESYSIFESLGAVRTSDPTDYDGCVVATYLARTYMIMHDWDNGAKYSKIVMDNFDILNTEGEILQGFSDISLPDVVFGCDITNDNSGIYMSWFSQMDYFGDGYAGIGVWRAGFGPFVDKIANDDIRAGWFLDLRNPLTMQIAACLYQSIKFIGAGREKVFNSGFDGTGWELGDYIYLRSEEAYLMHAECLAHKGNLTEAINELEDFMKTRQPSYTCAATTKAEFIKELNFQKRVEFWGEGIEFLDNRRLNIPVDRTNETWPTGNNHYAGGRIKAEQESENFLYQIPDAEIENNKMITEDDQN